MKIILKYDRWVLTGAWVGIRQNTVYTMFNMFSKWKDNVYDTINESLCK